MRTITQLNSEITRCKKQIAYIFDMPLNEQQTPSMKITLEGFQRQLYLLLNEHEHATKQIQVIKPDILCAGSSYRGNNMQQMAQNALHFTIKEAKQLASK